MGVYVLDAHALLALESAAAAQGMQVDDLLDALTTLAEQGELICSPLTLRDCREYGDSTDRIVTWARAASGHFRDASVTWDIVDHVITHCRTLVDKDETRESAQIEALALAVYRQRTGDDVELVTGQWVDTPMYTALGNTAANVSVSAITPDDFIQRL